MTEATQYNTVAAQIDDKLETPFDSRRVTTRQAIGMRWEGHNQPQDKYNPQSEKNTPQEMKPLASPAGIVANLFENSDNFRGISQDLLNNPEASNDIADVFAGAMSDELTATFADLQLSNDVMAIGENDIGPTIRRALQAAAETQLDCITEENGQWHINEKNIVAPETALSYHVQYVAQEMAQALGQDVTELRQEILYVFDYCAVANEEGRDLNPFPYLDHLFTDEESKNAWTSFKEKNGWMFPKSQDNPYGFDMNSQTDRLMNTAGEKAGQATLKFVKETFDFDSDEEALRLLDTVLNLDESELYKLWEDPAAYPDDALLLHIAIYTAKTTWQMSKIDQVLSANNFDKQRKKISADKELNPSQYYMHTTPKGMVETMRTDEGKDDYEIWKEIAKDLRQVKHFVDRRLNKIDDLT